MATNLSRPWNELVAQSTVELTAQINAVPLDLSATLPGQATTIKLEGGDYQLVSAQGEIIEGVLSGASTLKLVPYDPVPRVMFFQATFVPETTNVHGGAPGIEATLDRIVVWGLLITNGTDFNGARALPGKHQYEK